MNEEPVARDKLQPIRRKATLATLAILAVMAIAAVLSGHDVFDTLAHLAQVIFIGAPIVLVLFAARVPSTNRKQDRLVLTALGTAVVCGGIGYYATQVEPFWLEVTHTTLSSSKVSKPVRIAIVADIQTDHIGPYEARVFQAVVEEKPDLILFAGDNLQAPPEKRELLLETLNQALRTANFETTLGMVAVRGNTDYASSWEQAYDGLGVHCLTNQDVQLSEEIEVMGLGLRESIFEPPAMPETKHFRIMVGHSPDFALANPDADLMIAGHTHGGQVRLPGFGAIVSFCRVPRDWLAGLHDVNGKWLYVSRGIGMERGHAPRLRFFCRPELAIITLEPEQPY